MGKLIKNHWARLLVLSAAAFQLAAGLEGCFWPKFFFDFLTTNFNHAVKPFPILQIINIVFALVVLTYEWPLNFVAGTAIHTSLTLRMFWLPLMSLSCALLYQGMNPALYYLIGLSAYFWAYSDGEVICAVPWTLPKRQDKIPRVVYKV